MSIKVIRFTNDQGFSEIGQSMPLKYSLCKKTGESEFTEITGRIKCRDFLSEIYGSHRESTDFCIYGMQWKGSADSPDWSGLYLVLYFPNDKAKSDFKKNISFVREIEKRNKIPNIKLHEVGDEILVVANKKWLTNVLYMTLFTFLLRVSCYPIDPDNWIDSIIKLGGSDSNYVASVPRQTWDKVLGDLNIIKTDFWSGLPIKEHGISSAHHNSGFFSVFGSHTEIYLPKVRENKHWQIFIRDGDLLSHTKP